MTFNPSGFQQISRGLYLQDNAPILYRLHSKFRAWQVERLIAQEQRHYEAKTTGAGGSRPVADALKDRLARRGLLVRAKPIGDVHVLYASRPTYWEPHNIPPQFAATCKFTTYFYRDDRGLDDEKPDWLQKRSQLDADLLAFVSAVHAQHPIDLFLGYLAGWQVAPETIRRIGELGIVTCGFCLDDKLSFRGAWAGGRWSGPAALASTYDLNLTSAPSSIVKYEAEGGLAMFWPEAANPVHFAPLERPFEYDVSFIGARYGYRPTLIAYLQRQGINVSTFGPGWPNGPIPEAEMVEVYARSRINLGFGGIGYSTRAMGLKGRDFEVPMCGALYLTSHNPELELVYQMGDEIVTYKDARDCLMQIQLLLGHSERAAKISRAARLRCLQDHTWAKRLQKLLGVCQLTA